MKTWNYIIINGVPVLTPHSLQARKT